MRTTSLLLALCAVTAVPSGARASGGEGSTRHEGPKTWADLAARPPPDPPAWEDPVVRALREEPELAAQARSGRRVRNTGIGIAAAGLVAVPVGLVVGLSYSGLGADASNPNKRTAEVLIWSGVAGFVVGSVVALNGQARRADAIARWNEAHPDRPVRP